MDAHAPLGIASLVPIGEMSHLKLFNLAENVFVLFCTRCTKRMLNEETTSVSAQCIFHLAQCLGFSIRFETEITQEGAHRSVLSASIRHSLGLHKA
jgi:hypothetical protein